MTANGRSGVFINILLEMLPQLSRKEAQAV
jgi:hypothetical protein